MHLPVALIAAVATQLLCQAFKVVYYSARDRRLSFKYFTTSGGMPSSHSAFVTSLCVAILVHSGIDSDAFAVAAVFGFIVMHDAYRLRGTVEKQSRVINLLVADRKDKAVADLAAKEQLPEMLGHTLGEIAAGIVVGAVLGGGFSYLLQRFVAG